MGSFQKGPVTLKIPKVWHPNFVRYFLLSKYAVKKIYIVIVVAAAQQFKKIFWGVNFTPSVQIGLRINVVKFAN